MSPGYWNDYRMTRKKFNDSKYPCEYGGKSYKTEDLGYEKKDGNIVFVGRKDDQIKYMGYRIELNEIEQSLISIERVNEAAVILFNEKDSDLKEIIAFIAVNNNNLHDCSNTNSHIRENLKRILPAYMLPKKIFELEEIPRTDRGKIDREELKKILNNKYNYENNIK